MVTEALTNVQPNATNARTVCINVRRTERQSLTVTVTDDLASATPASRRGGLGLLGLAERGAGARMAEFILGAMAAGGALLTLGLAQRWGSVFPRWIPFLRGRRVPVWLAVVPATAVAGILTASGLAINRGFTAMHLGWTAMEPVARAENWGAWLPPLLWLVWGLALGAATVAYRRRRAREDGRAPRLLHPGQTYTPSTTRAACRLQADCTFVGQRWGSSVAAAVMRVARVAAKRSGATSAGGRPKNSWDRW